MTEINSLIPRQAVPPLHVSLVGGGAWQLEAQTPERFTLIVFYRGLHCPICAGYTKELSKMQPAFNERGVEVIAVSSDSEERASRSWTEWELGHLPIGYGLKPAVARQWGLYLSHGRGPTGAGMDEPALFCEPALYLVRADKTLYFGSVQTMPFARPRFDDLLKAIDFVIAKDYPARGEASD